MHLRVLQLSDLGFCDELRRAVGWNQRPEDWLRFLRLSPDGCFLAEIEGKPVGTVTTIQFGQELGWIGMLIVSPEFRGRGVGGTLLQKAVGFLQSGGVQSVKLDATPQGEPLYARSGFQREFTLQRWEGKPPARPIAASESVRDLASGDFRGVVRLDQEAFGVNRADLLHAVCAEARRTVVAGGRGRPVGFAVLRAGARANQLGPVVAPDRETAAELVSALLSDTTEPTFWDVPERVSAPDLPSEFGFEVQRPLVRMWLGENLEAAAPESYWGILDPAAG